MRVVPGTQTTRQTRIFSSLKIGRPRGCEGRGSKSQELSRGSVVVTRQAHNLEDAGSTPAPAIMGSTKPDANKERRHENAEKPILNEARSKLAPNNQ